MSLIYSTPLLVSAAFGLFLALFIARHSVAAGARSLTALVLAASLWSFGYALEFLSPDLQTKLFWAKFQYFGIATISPAWLVFTYRYLGFRDWPGRSPRAWSALGIVPILTILLVWTNEAHRLVWREVQLHPAGPVQILEIYHAPWFWIFLTFSYVLVLWGTFRMSRALLGSVRLHRWQIRLGLLAVLVPWLSNLIYIAGLGPLEYLDLTPFAFTIAGMLFAISLFRFQFGNIQPIAHQEIFDGLADCLLVLDRNDCIVDLNPAAQKMIGDTGGQPLGKTFAQVLPEFARCAGQEGLEEECQVEVTLGEGPEQQIYQMRIAPLIGPHKRAVGRLVVCHEITQLKQQQEHLEQEVAERTQALRSVIEQLQSELSERNLAEKRFEDVVESAPDAMLLVDQSGAIRLVNAQAERLFGYQREELLGQNAEILIPMRRREIHHRGLQEYAAHPSVREMNVNLDAYALRKNGAKFPVEISLGPLKTGDGLWVACNVRDISERKRVEAEQNRLLEEIKQSREQLRALAIRLQEVQEIERRQIANELHDRVGQNLTGLNLNLQIIDNQLALQTGSAVRNRLAEAQKLVEATTRQVRDVMVDLNPPVLEEYGLVSALHWYCTNFSQRTGIAARVAGEELAPRLPPKEETVLFRIVQEALNNAAKHARATQVVVAVDSSRETICVKIQDDGLGFDPQAPHAPEDQPHWGLLTMEQRAASIGGQLVIDSAPGRGTLVCVVVQRSQDED